MCSGIALVKRNGALRCSLTSIKVSLDVVAVTYPAPTSKNAREHNLSCPEKPDDGQAMEVDFERSLVCAATLCMPVERLTVIGDLHLKQLLENAFRDLDMMSMSHGVRPIHPVHVGTANESE